MHLGRKMVQPTAMQRESEMVKSKAFHLEIQKGIPMVLRKAVQMAPMMECY